MEMEREREGEGTHLRKQHCLFVRMNNYNTAKQIAPLALCNSYLVILTSVMVVSCDNTQTLQGFTQSHMWQT